MKGVSTLEYAVLILVLVAGLLATQVYIKRGLQGGFRASADNLGSQYAPENTTSDITFETHSDVTTTTETVEVEEGNKKKLQTTVTVNIHYDNSNRSGWEEVGELESSLY